MAGKYRKFTPEFREEAARMVRGNIKADRGGCPRLGVNETSLGNWVRDYRKKHAEDEPPSVLSERARLRELERENRELRMKMSSFQKPRRTSRRSIGDERV